MKKQHRYGMIATLTLGLCLVATHAFSGVEYDLINSSGGTIQARCAGNNNSYSDMANGTTQSFECNKGTGTNTGNLLVRVAGSTQSVYNIPQQCYGGPTEITVTAGDNAGELSLSIMC